MTAEIARVASPSEPPSLSRQIVAATVGNVLEWFDFVVYGFFAVTIAEVFFPADTFEDGSGCRSACT
jgi:MHS family proline/betaine transporter-like MFS transporter